MHAIVVGVISMACLAVNDVASDLQLASGLREMVTEVDPNQHCLSMADNGHPS